MSKCCKSTALRHLLLLLLVALVALSACAQSKQTVQEQSPADKSAEPVAGAAEPAEQWWAFPLPGCKVISPYGRRGGRHHTGVDLKTVNKDEIHAAFDGEVVYAAKFYGYGLLIRIRHDNGLETYYSHNSKNLVEVGDHVKAGQVIALTGQTGRASTPHLHFETRIAGQTVNPNRFFDFQNHTIRLKAFNKKRDGYVVKP